MSESKVWLGLDVSTACIGICILVDDGSQHGKIAELTHISPKVPKGVKGIEELFIKKNEFHDFIKGFSKYKFDRVIIEEPLVSSNNKNTVATLLRFNGMISDCIYNELGIVPDYISSYDARKYAFPELMGIRKYGKDNKQYDYNKIIKEIKSSKFVLFGDYPWAIDKKTIIQEKVAEFFPKIEWLYDKKGELKKENFDATDAYVACFGQLNKERYGEPNFNVSNISETQGTVEFDVSYWGKTEHRESHYIINK